MSGLGLVYYKDAGGGSDGFGVMLLPGNIGNICIGDVRSIRAS